jgi:hypothetical protein
VEKKLADNQNILMKDPSELFGGIFCLKRSRIFLLLMFLFGVTNAQTTEVKIDDAKQSFETVNQGEVVRLKYVVSNIGTVPLIIKDYEVECSCTTADYDTQPILPGKSTTITVKFDTKSAYERQDRAVYINCNTKDGFFKLRFKGNVKKNK